MADAGPPARRIVVLGGTGLFGAAAVERLRADGLKPLVGTRRGRGDLRLDVNSRASIKSALRQLDVVVDAAGPFQARTTALLEAALEIGFDVVDLSDSLEYAEKVEGLRLRIEAAGIRVLTSCSSVSAISAAALRLSGFEKPQRLSVCLSPASRYSASPATAQSLLSSIGVPIRIFRDGRLGRVLGWRDTRMFTMPLPAGRVRGHLCSSCDAHHLPSIWPSLRRIDFYVNGGPAPVAAALGAAGRFPWARALVKATLPMGLAVARLFGSKTGCLAFEVEDARRQVWTLALVSSRKAYATAVVPATLAAAAIARGRFPAQGFIPPDRQVDPTLLLDELTRLGVDVVTTRHGARPAGTP